ncbi:T9SS C-terminal target domain-containing protein [Chryseobacterium carnipullorum]|uniref:1,4-alpha-glucan branching enzyme GlgB n=1 Tax=Chryseobacterium carnipullorum TaxID=1124835 RepID=A0A376ES91_CHRCU|nr:alpha-amylase family glycosyl hydrolase [Chryseobacterium carnipullorum]AZA48061.1 T9SS C-terminal target domain-containing protein [Chryseobacterium carnipullorum]AZA67375.1 T9SS C-terminal target domain-containing protein [Chryseobacterium carnipullorum]STD13730.1 1,4-alpha-glucan branching enzyme GlgB [Chryseobacterium carnipullorum]
MKKFYSLVYLLVAVFSFGQINYTIAPNPFNETDAITLTVPGDQIDESAWGVSNNSIYMWSWSFDTNYQNSQDCPTNGSWNNSNDLNKLSYNSITDTYSLTFTPTTFYGRTGIGRFGFLLKDKTGSHQTSPDIFVNVGILNLNLTNPVANSLTTVPSGNSVNITATTNVSAIFQLKANGTVVNSTSVPSQSYNYSYTVTQDANMELIATDTNSNSKNAAFILQTPRTVISEAIPGWIRQGINYLPSDQTKVGLALYAPHKNFVHVIGSFNNWAVNDAYLMKRDTANPDLYWIELNGLTPQQLYTFQYRTNDLKKVADPYSPQILSSYDDQWISNATYPNLPPFPAGQDFEVSMFKTGQAPYNWQTINFQRPAKEDLVVYELLLRDFTQEKNWQSLINKISYLKNLNINAIELLPIMEFEGNLSWGYNTSFHYALDKAYGTPEKFKEFVDLCHQNGIAVILDIAFNHATGRSPLARLWNIDPDGDGYGEIAANNPYFNQVPKHSYNVFNDFNHTSPSTQYYVERSLQQWLTEYHIDGFRWDLTKGFTQNCSENDEVCTNAYQQDRVDIMKQYADKQWAIDPNSYMIFEHLGTDAEEQQWANYRIDEGKGVMLWNKQTDPYNQNTMGYKDNSNYDRMNHSLHGFTNKSAVGYGESHDEERLMFKNLAYGAINGNYNVTNLTTALERMKTFGATFFTIPGPKMIWQFGELGYEFSINRCANGTINSGCRTDEKPVAFTLGYDTNASRKAVYDTWAKIINIRNSHQVFKSKTYTIESNNLTNDPEGLITRIYVYDNTLNGMKNVVVLANYTTSAQNVIPYFPYAGQWQNLMDNTISNFASTTTPIMLQPGEFRVFGNYSGALATVDVNAMNKLSLQIADNPVKNGLVKLIYHKVKNGDIVIFDMSGKKMDSFQLPQENGTYELKLAYPSGTYLVHLRSETGTAIQKMVIK